MTGSHVSTGPMKAVAFKDILLQNAHRNQKVASPLRSLRVVFSIAACSLSCTKQFGNHVQHLVIDFIRRLGSS